ncbi:hypothetical protein ER575_16825 [Enterococcus faecalis]|nr:hypothetical protein [Enterococcus faecalis]EGO8426375.1 hypothetical protein [Enterococcus faecalis]
MVIETKQKSPKNIFFILIIPFVIYCNIFEMFL